MFVAKAIINQPKISGTSVIKRVFFLPILSIKIPPSTHPIGVVVDDRAAENF
jgi:hypothetical protein